MTNIESVEILEAVNKVYSGGDQEDQIISKMIQRAINLISLKEAKEKLNKALKEAEKEDTNQTDK